MAVRLTHEEVAETIEKFLDGTGGSWDWDDFTSVRILDPTLDAVRLRCVSLPERFPPIERGHYCGPEGVRELEQLIVELRKGDVTADPN